MLIPTNVKSGEEQTLAVPGPDYFASTAAHYYVNPPEYQPRTLVFGVQQMRKLEIGHLMLLV